MFIPKEPLTKENIFKRISSYDIFRTYSDNFKELNKSFPSDLRPDDSNPSAQIAIIHNEPLYTDFGLGESFRAIDFLMRLKGISYPEALQQINKDFDLGLGGTVIIGNPGISKTIPMIGNTPAFKEKSFTVLKKRQRPFTKRDLEYWNSFYWTEEMLKLSKTQSMSHYWVNEYRFDVKPNELAFTYEYYWHNYMQRKFYFPERQDFKWITNCDSTVVQLVDVCPKEGGDVLFLTSSKKDAGIFWRINIDKMFPNLTIHGVAPTTEGSFVIEPWFRKMQTRWKRIILWYNNDWNKPTNTGVINSRKFSEKFGIEWYVNPDGMEKDPSDYAKRYGLQEFKQLIESKL